MSFDGEYFGAHPLDILVSETAVRPPPEKIVSHEVLRTEKARTDKKAAAKEKSDAAAAARTEHAAAQAREQEAQAQMQREAQAAQQRQIAVAAESKRAATEQEKVRAAAELRETQRRQEQEAAQARAMQESAKAQAKAVITARAQEKAPPPIESHALAPIDVMVSETSLKPLPVKEIVNERHEQNKAEKLLQKEQRRTEEAARQTTPDAPPPAAQQIVKIVPTAVEVQEIHPQAPLVGATTAQAPIVVAPPAPAYVPPPPPEQHVLTVTNVAPSEAPEVEAHAPDAIAVIPPSATKPDDRGLLKVVAVAAGAVATVIYFTRKR